MNAIKVERGAYNVRKFIESFNNVIFLGRFETSWYHFRGTVAVANGIERAGFEVIHLDGDTYKARHI
jgi:hypothetical protein